MLADLELAKWIDSVRSARPARPSIEGLRAPKPRPQGPDLAEVSTDELDADPRLRVRWFRTGAMDVPTVVYVHGGGFVYGDLESHDRVCRRLAVEAAVDVVAVDYRRAPEYPAPAAIDDVVSAVQELALSRSGRRWAMAGDSAGGFIAVQAARQLCAMEMTPHALLLLCPNADLTLTQPSTRVKGRGWGLCVDDLRWMIAQWMPDASGDELADASPINADLSDLPPTILVTAEHDPLRDEGHLLAQVLRRDEVSVDEIDLVGHVHGFITLDSVSPAARAAGDDVFRRLGALLRRRDVSS